MHNKPVDSNYNEQLKCRYYFNISELLEVGQDIDDITLETYYDQEGNTDVVGPIKIDENGNYYVEFIWDNQFNGAREIQFGLIAAQDDMWKAHWSSENDWSAQNLIIDDFVKTENVTLYIGDKLVYGIEP